MRIIEIYDTATESITRITVKDDALHITGPKVSQLVLDIIKPIKREVIDLLTIESNEFYKSISVV